MEFLFQIIILSVLFQNSLSLPTENIHHVKDTGINEKSPDFLDATFTNSDHLGENNDAFHHFDSYEDVTFFHRHAHPEFCPSRDKLEEDWKDAVSNIIDVIEKDHQEWEVPSPENVSTEQLVKDFPIGFEFLIGHNLLKSVILVSASNASNKQDFYKHLKRNHNSKEVNKERFGIWEHLTDLLKAHSIKPVEEHIDLQKERMCHLADENFVSFFSHPRIFEMLQDLESDDRKQNDTKTDPETQLFLQNAGGDRLPFEKLNKLMQNVFETSKNTSRASMNMEEIDKTMKPDGLNHGNWTVEDLAWIVENRMQTVTDDLPHYNVEDFLLVLHCARDQNPVFFEDSNNFLEHLNGENIADVLHGLSNPYPMQKVDHFDHISDPNLNLKTDYFEGSNDMQGLVDDLETRKLLNENSSIYQEDTSGVGADTNHFSSHSDAVLRQKAASFIFSLFFSNFATIQQQQAHPNNHSSCNVWSDLFAHGLRQIRIQNKTDLLVAVFLESHKTLAYEWIAKNVLLLTKLVSYFQTAHFHSHSKFKHQEASYGEEFPFSDRVDTQRDGPDVYDHFSGSGYDMYGLEFSHNPLDSNNIPFLDFQNHMTPQDSSYYDLLDKGNYNDGLSGQNGHNSPFNGSELLFPNGSATYLFDPRKLGQLLSSALPNSSDENLNRTEFPIEDPNDGPFSGSGYYMPDGKMTHQFDHTQLSRMPSLPHPPPDDNYADFPAQDSNSMRFSDSIWAHQFGYPPLGHLPPPLSYPYDGFGLGNFALRGGFDMMKLKNSTDFDLLCLFIDHMERNIVDSMEKFNIVTLLLKAFVSKQHFMKFHRNFSPFTTVHHTDHEINFGPNPYDYSGHEGSEDNDEGVVSDHSDGSFKAFIEVMLNRTRRNSSDEHFGPSVADFGSGDYSGANTFSYNTQISRPRLNDSANFPTEFHSPNPSLGEGGSSNGHSDPSNPIFGSENYYGTDFFQYLNYFLNPNPYKTTDFPADFHGTHSSESSGSTFYPDFDDYSGHERTSIHPVSNENWEAQFNSFFPDHSGSGSAEGHFMKHDPMNLFAHGYGELYKMLSGKRQFDFPRFFNLLSYELFAHDSPTLGKINLLDDKKLFSDAFPYHPGSLFDSSMPSGSGSYDPMYKGSGVDGDFAVSKATGWIQMSEAVLRHNFHRMINRTEFSPQGFDRCSYSSVRNFTAMWTNITRLLKNCSNRRSFPGTYSNYPNPYYYDYYFYPEPATAHDLDDYDSVPDFVSSNPPTGFASDFGILLADIPGISSLMLVEGIPSKAIGSFEFQKPDEYDPGHPQSNSTEKDHALHDQDENAHKDRSKTELVSASGTDSLNDRPSNASISSPVNGTGSYPDIFLPPTHQKCSIGWLCVDIGTVLEKSYRIRFKPANSSQPICGLLQIALRALTNATKKELSLGFIFCPSVFNLTKPVNCPQNSTDPIGKVVSLKIFNQTAHINVSMLATQLHVPLKGFHQLLTLNKTSQPVQEFFKKLQVLKSRLQLRIDESLLQHFTVAFNKTVLNGSGQHLYDFNLTIPFNNSILLKGKHNETLGNHHFYLNVKFPFACSWTTFYILFQTNTEFSNQIPFWPPFYNQNNHTLNYSGYPWPSLKNQTNHTLDYSNYPWPSFNNQTNHTWNYPDYPWPSFNNQTNHTWNYPDYPWPLFNNQTNHTWNYPDYPWPLFNNQTNHTWNYPDYPWPLFNNQTNHTWNYPDYPWPLFNNQTNHTWNYPGYPWPLFNNQTNHTWNYPDYPWPLFNNQTNHTWNYPDYPWPSFNNQTNHTWNYPDYPWPLFNNQTNHTWNYPDYPWPSFNNQTNHTWNYPDYSLPLFNNQTNHTWNYPDYPWPSFNNQTNHTWNNPDYPWPLFNNQTNHTWNYPDYPWPSFNNQTNQTWNYPDYSLPLFNNQTNHTWNYPDYPWPSFNNQTNHTWNYPDYPWPSFNNQTNHTWNYPDYPWPLFNNQTNHTWNYPDYPWPSFNNQTNHTWNYPDYPWPLFNNQTNHTWNYPDYPWPLFNNQTNHTWNYPDYPWPLFNNQTNHTWNYPDYPWPSFNNQTNHTWNYPDYPWPSFNNQTNHTWNYPDYPWPSFNNQTNHTWNYPDYPWPSFNNQTNHTLNYPGYPIFPQNHSNSNNNQFNSSINPYHHPHSNQSHSIIDKPRPANEINDHHRPSSAIAFLPDFVSPYIPSGLSNDSGSLLVEATRISSLVIVVEVPDKAVGRFEYKEEQDNTVRTKRELGPGSNVSFLHHHANDGIPSQNNITNTQLGSIIPTPHEECSVGWKCLELGSIIDGNHRIRFRPAKTSQPSFGLIQIVFRALTNATNQETSVGFLLFPPVANQMKPAECFQNKTGVEKVVNLKILYNQTANISFSMLSSQLKPPITGLHQLLELNETSQIVQEFFKKLQVSKSRVQLRIDSDMVPQYIINYNQTHRIGDASTSHDRELNLLLPVNGSVFVKARNNETLKNPHFLLYAKYLFECSWTKVEINLLLPPTFNASNHNPNFQDPHNHIFNHSTHLDNVILDSYVYTLQSGQKLLSQVSGFCPQLKLGWKRAILEAFDFLNRTLTKSMLGLPDIEWMQSISNPHLKSIIGHGFLKSVFLVSHLNTTDLKEMETKMETSPFKQTIRQWKALAHLMKDFEREATAFYLDEISRLVHANEDMCAENAKKFIYFVRNPIVFDILDKIRDGLVFETEEIKEAELDDLSGHANASIFDENVADFLDHLIQYSLMNESGFASELQRHNETQEKSDNPPRLHYLKAMLWLVKYPDRLSSILGSDFEQKIPEFNLTTLPMLFKCLNQSISQFRHMGPSSNVTYMFPNEFLPPFHFETNFTNPQGPYFSNFTNSSLSEKWVHDQEKIMEWMVQSILFNENEIMLTTQEISELFTNSESRSNSHPQFQELLTTIEDEFPNFIDENGVAAQLSPYVNLFQYPLESEIFESTFTETACDPWFQSFTKLLRTLQENEKLKVVFEFFLNDLLEHLDMWLSSLDHEVHLPQNFDNFYNSQASIFMEGYKASMNEGHRILASRLKDEMEIITEQEHLVKDLLNLYSSFSENIVTEFPALDQFDLSDFFQDSQRNTSRTSEHFKILQLFIDVVEFEMLGAGSFDLINHFFSFNPPEFLHHFAVTESVISILKTSKVPDFDLGDIYSLIDSLDGGYVQIADLNLQFESVFEHRDFLDEPDRDLPDEPYRNFTDEPDRDLLDEPDRDLPDDSDRDMLDEPEKDFPDDPDKNLPDDPDRDTLDEPKIDFPDESDKDLPVDPDGDFPDDPDRTLEDNPDLPDGPDRDLKDEPDRNFNKNISKVKEFLSSVERNRSDVIDHLLFSFKSFSESNSLLDGKCENSNSSDFPGVVKALYKCFDSHKSNTSAHHDWHVNERPFFQNSSIENQQAHPSMPIVRPGNVTVLNSTDPSRNPAENLFDHRNQTNPYHGSSNQTETNHTRPVGIGPDIPLRPINDTHGQEGSNNSPNDRPAFEETLPDTLIEVNIAGLIDKAGTKLSSVVDISRPLVVVGLSEELNGVLEVQDKSVSRKKRRSGSSHPSFNPSSSDPIPSGLINILQQSSELDDNVNDYFDSVKQNGRRKRRSNGDQAPVGPIDEIEHVLECSPGWICVVVGTELSPDDVIRLNVKNDVPIYVGLTQIGFVDLTTQTERILGLISNPGIFTDAQTGPGGLDLDKEVLEDIEIAAEVLLKLPDDDIIAVPMTYLNKSLVYPVQGINSLMQLQNLSNEVGMFFEKLKEERSKIDILLPDAIFEDIEILQQTPGTRSMKALRSTYLESVIVQGSLLFRPKFKNFDKVYNVLVKYHSTTMWTRLRVTIAPRIKIDSKIDQQDASLMTVSFNYEDNAPYSVAFVANALSYTELPATKLGIVVLWKSSFERGYLQYRCRNGSVRSINETSSGRTLLSPSCSVWFNPLEVNTFWKPGQVRMQIFLFDTDILAESPNRNISYQTSLQHHGYIFLREDCEKHEACQRFDDILSGYQSTTSADVIVERYGCDGRRSTWPAITFDDCGVCGGKDECIDCNGVIHGMAVINQCGVCSGGSTGIDPSSGIDCGGSCAEENEIDDCGFCQKKSKRKRLKDCAGECYGDAKLNECNFCVRPNQTEGIVINDECGVCGGNGSSCAGCDGIPNSGMVTDNCGSCLHPSHADFNKGCEGNIGHLYIPNPFQYVEADSEFVVLTLVGWLSSFEEAACTLTLKSSLEFTPQSVSVAAQLIFTKKSESIRSDELHDQIDEGVGWGMQYIPLSIEISQLFSGPNQIRVEVTSVLCKLRRLERSLHNTTAEFVTPVTFQKLNHPILNHLTPDSVPISSEGRPVTIAGDYFSEDLTYVCIVGNGADGDFVREAKEARRQDSTNVECEIPSSNFSVETTLFVFTELELNFINRERIRSYRPLKFYYKEPAPRVIESRLSNDLRYIVVQFDKNILTKPDVSCSDLFNSESVEQIGVDAFCFVWKNNKILVLPSQDATFLRLHLDNEGRVKREINESNSLGSLVFLEDSITGGDPEAFFEKFPATAFNVDKPTMLVIPEVTLSGRTYLGPCDKAILKYDATNGVGEWPFALHWTLVPNEGSNVTLNVISTDTSRYVTHDMEETWAEVTCYLQVTNGIGIVSDVASHKFIRSSVPSELSLSIVGPKKRIIKTSENLRIKTDAKVRLRKCGSSDDEGEEILSGSVIYNWEATTSPQISFSLNVDVIKGDKNTWGPNLFIPKGLLTSTITYNFTVTALFTNTDGTLHERSDYVLVETASQQLVPVISSQYSDGLVNSSDNLVLNGKNSYDPDNSPDAMLFQWTCETLEGFPCIVTDAENPGKKIRAEEAFAQSEKTSEPGVIVIRASRFPLSENLNFTLTVQKPGRTSQKSILLKVEHLPSDIPRIVLITPKSFSSSRILRIKAQLTSASYSPFEGVASWVLESTQPAGLPSGFRLEDASSTPVAMQIKLQKDLPVGISLVLKRNVLNSGQNYKVRLLVKSKSNLSAIVVEATADLNTPSRPIAGKIEVEPSEGTAMSTDFVLRTFGWTEVLTSGDLSENQISTPVYTYKFGYFSEEKGKQKLTLLRSYSEEAEVTNVKLPPGVGDMNELELVVFTKRREEEKDYNAAKATIKVKVNPLQAENADAVIERVGSLAEESILTGNPKQAASFISVLDDAIPHFQEDADHKKQMQKLADDFTALLTDYAPKTENEAVETLQSANNVFSRVGVSNESVETAAKLPTNILSSLDLGSSSNSRKKRQTDDSTLTSTTDELSVETAREILEVYDSIFESKASFAAELLVPRQEFQKSVDEISTKFCRSVAYLEPATEIESSLSEVAVAKYSNITENTVIGGVNHQIKLSDEVGDAYSSWECSADAGQCSGACISVGEFSNDVVTWYQTESQEERKSNMLLISVRNPESGELADDRLPTDDSAALEIEFVQVEPKTDGTSYACLHWNDYFWEGDKCSVSSVLYNPSTDATGIICQCSVAVGYFAVFAVESEETTTSSKDEDTTASSTSTTAATTTTSDSLACVYPLVAEELCSSICIPTCDNVDQKPSLCTKRCVPTVECICPTGQVFGDNNECVSIQKCFHSKESSPESSNVLLIGVLAGSAAGLIIIILVLIAVKMHKSNKQCRVKNISSSRQYLDPNPPLTGNYESLGPPDYYSQQPQSHLPHTPVATK